jgi:hypothetical protein
MLALLLGGPSNEVVIENSLLTARRPVACWPARGCEI